MTSPALASPGCDAANAGTFNTTVPTGTNQFVQRNGQFDVGDILTATFFGTPLSAFVDLVFGVTPQQLISLANANGSGSATVTTSGNNIIDISIAAGAGGATNLVFSCTPAAGGGGGATPGTPQAAAEQADTATNATTTSTIVENRTVSNIIDSASHADPESTTQSPERVVEQIERLERLSKLVTDQFLIANGEQRRIKLIKGRTSETVLSGYDPAEVVGARREGESLAEYEVRAAKTITEYEDRLLKAWKEETKALLAEAEQRIETAEKKIEELLPPGMSRLELLNAPDELRESLNTGDGLEELGDGDSILFAGRDPFTRALARYRGFKLDVADTGEGFGDSVKPLSFTQTLSSTIVGWVRAVYTDYEQDDASQQDGDNILVALGAHKDINDDLRIGVFATTTWGDVTSPVNNLDIETMGYSLGAYGRYKLGDVDLNASTRIGLTDNDIAVSGTTGSYDTRLASATVGVSGQEKLSDNIWMRPAISLTGTWVNREDYVNSAGTNIGGNTTWSGNVTAGPTIGMNLKPPSGFKRLNPAIGLQASYTFSDQDTQAGTVATSEDDYLSLSLSPQLSMEFDNGASLDVFGSYFGIGADLDGWSLGGTLSIPLN